jgi:hypothetical protein
MPNWFKPKYNTGNVLPEIESMLQAFDYGGLTDPDAPINPIAMDIMRDDFGQALSAKPYLNIYQFKAGGGQFYLCDRALTTSVETRRHVCILASGKSFPLGFEIAQDDYFINNDCEQVDKIGKWNICVEHPDEYEGLKSLLISILPICERFSTSSTPVSLFSFPQDGILGYHVSGRQLIQDEIVAVVPLLQRFP